MHLALSAIPTLSDLDVFGRLVVAAALVVTVNTRNRGMTRCRW